LKSISLLNGVRKLVRKFDDSEFVKEYDIREHKFMAMEEEKRERVIDAALKEFSQGYTTASTDDIVKEAGISKGLLFHYFGSKRGLLLFLVKYVLSIFYSEYEKAISYNNDFLENIRMGSKVKLGLSVRYPLMFKFMIKAHSAMKEAFPEGLPGDLAYSPLMTMQLVCQRSDNDKALFKEGIDREKAQNIIMWTVNGLIDNLLRYGDDFNAYEAHHDELIKELDEYLLTLRNVLYR
jgi:TetR/AcrR family transcriptional regulator